MPKVIQIRDVPDDVHDALSAAAAAEGLSLTRYLLRELDQVARRTQIARHNSTVIHRTRDEVGATVDRETVLSALREGRGE
ncbi:FitA-like ribbon-helix-helix domain-containing protein [Nocardia lasii]|uniref:Antitoxin FitA-like ribbon-helix-helix domain-containing protein n=1 Tax=Nocardia lasii TaxID=1616107 RepID=A0ABW1JZC2_9NOCA